MFQIRLILNIEADLILNQN